VSTTSKNGEYGEWFGTPDERHNHAGTVATLRRDDFGASAACALVTVPGLSWLDDRENDSIIRA
jgi:hypothetical protein